MDIIDFNGEGPWSRTGILTRYAAYAAQEGLPRRDLSPSERVEGNRRWVYPVMEKVIEGIEASDASCIRLGIEFIEEDTGFRFGRILKAKMARALRRTTLSDEQRARILRRVFSMLRAGNVPREYREYAKLARKIGFDRNELSGIQATTPYVARWLTYFSKSAAGGD